MSSDDISLQHQKCNTEYIYKKYKECFAEIIAYIEVYEHDLPEKIMTQIAELFQTIAIYETSPQTDDISNILLKANLKVMQSLYKHAIFVFINKIREYKKTFKRFKYKGIMLEGQNFAEVVKRKEKDITGSFSKKLLKCYRRNIFTTFTELSLKEKYLYIVGYVRVFMVSSFTSLRKEPYLPIDSLVPDCIDEVSFADTYEDIKELVELYEDVRPNVISNGAKQSFSMSVFIAICSWVVPGLLVLPFVIRIISMIEIKFK